MSRPDEGSATVLALTTCAVVAMVTAVLAGMGLATVARHRAAAAADAAALTAAARTAAGATSACAAAARVLESDGARLIDCSVSGAFALVRAEVAAPPWMPWAGAATGVAKAGPDADAEKTGGVARAS